MKRSRRMCSTVVATALVFAGCGSDSGTTISSGAEAESTTPTTVAVSEPPATEPPTMPPTTAAPSTSPATTTPAPTTTTIDPAAPTYASTAVEVSCPSAAPVDFQCWTVAVPVDYFDPTGASFDLAVTATRASPDSWTSPVLRQVGAWASTDWAFPQVIIAGHDSIWVDSRGFGASAPLPACPGVEDRVGNYGVGDWDVELVGLLQDCVAQATEASPSLESVFDLDNIARDLSTVRRALGIDSWSLAGRQLALDPMIRLLALEPETVTSIIATAPAVAGQGRSYENNLAVFERFADDCAALANCSSNGDLFELLNAAVIRLNNEVVASAVDRDGDPVFLNATSVLQGIAVALSESTVAPVLPTLLAQVVDGNDTAAAQYFVRPRLITGATLAWYCQQLSFIRPALDDLGGTDSDNPFVITTRQGECDTIGSVPQVVAPPTVSSSIPVLVLVPEYDTSTSIENAEAIFAQFDNVTTVLVPGITDLGAQLTDCYGTVRKAFLDNPGAAVDTTCLSEPAVQTLS